MRRIIHAIIRMRLDFPTTTIYLTKYDFEAAYRRLHVFPTHTVTTILIYNSLAYLLTRMPFGSTCGPIRYSDISESIFDLANDLIEDNTWDPSTFHSPISTKLDKPEKLQEEIPFAKAKELDVEIPSRETVVDGYIDDIKKNLLRAQNAVPLVTHAVFRPVSQNEPVERIDTISEIKLKGEGTPTEQKVILGWIIDTRELKIHLPMEKTIYWNEEISRKITKNYKVKTKELESMIGRLNHIGYILPNGRYFLNRIRKLLWRCEKYGPQILNKAEINDFLLWKEFITQSSQEGISLNLIAFTAPDSRIYTDASSVGMGGYNPYSGQAWRYKLPTWMANQFHINTLEFIPSTIGTWLEIKNSTIDYTKILCMTDNSSAVGWLYKSNFDPDKQTQHGIISRKLASILLHSNSALYPQHIPGKNNVIADSLSRDFHIPAKHLAFALKSLFPEQTPVNLTISETLPQEITSFLEWLRDSQTNAKGSPPAPAPSKTGVSLAGSASLPDVVSRINSWIRLQRQQKSPSCPHLQRLFEETKEAAQRKLSSLETQSAKPCLTYVRYSGQTFAGPQSLTMMENMHRQSDAK